MKREEFDYVVAKQLGICMQVLTNKNKEYQAKSPDPFHNFRTAAEVTGTSPEAALAGMMAKHTVSLYDMCKNGTAEYSESQWTEKITDHINYLLILKAMVVAAKEKKS